SENSAPALNTGRYKVEPAIRSFTSIFPPNSPGGRVRISPGAAGATPMTPQNGPNGTTAGESESVESSSNCQIKRKGSGKRSGKKPSPGVILVHPQPRSWIFTTSTRSVSPGLAPLIATGPVSV